MLPTVLELSDRGAIVLLLSHFGRPKGETRPDMSTAQLVLPIHRPLGRSVRFIEDCAGPEAERAISTMLPGTSVSSRTHASTRVRKERPEAGKGDGGARRLSMSTTLLDRASRARLDRGHHAICQLTLAERWRPSSSAEAGAGQSRAAGRGRRRRRKVSTKLAVLGHLVSKVDHLIIGGGMANTFLAARGVNVGKSLCEHELTGQANAIFDRRSRQDARSTCPTKWWSRRNLLQIRRACAPATSTR